MPKLEPKLNDTQAAILGVLHEGKMIGGDIVSITAKWMPYFSITRSQVYRELKVMTAKGFVTEGAPGSRGSVPYRISPAGKRAFQAWMTSEPTLDGIRNTMALRQAFAQYAPDGSLINIKDQYIALHLKARDEINARLQEAHDEELWNDQSALRFAFAYHEAALNWLGVRS